MSEKKMTCPRCKVAMVPQPEKLDFSWFGDGPNPDPRFAGILVEIHRCPSCWSQAMRPAVLNLPTARPAVAV